ncbi:MAG: capsular biosynthesis protein, partial [Sphingorhabdus sp.]|nr:capsular biosynthesis protein [Sphingorhabdus sp.]
NITDLLVFGDCRPYHVAAIRIAQTRGIRVHVLEEGYIRPDWMTLERDGVNGYSRMPTNPEWFVETARNLPPRYDSPHVTASFKRRTRDGFWHYANQLVDGGRFPHYEWHRPGSLLRDAAYWAHKLIRQKWQSSQDEKLERFLSEKTGKFFLLPLQLSADYQIRLHSPFPDMVSALCYIVDNFKHNAPQDTHLLIKSHPLYAGFFSWKNYIEKLAIKTGLVGRIHYIDGGNLEKMCAASNGMVCVNSTSATFALSANRPVAVLGKAVYNIRGITHQGLLDEFWSNPTAPDHEVFDAFCHVLRARYLVRGGLSSQSAVRMLVETMAKRLFADRGEKMTQPSNQLHPVRPAKWATKNRSG